MEYGLRWQLSVPRTGWPAATRATASRRTKGGPAMVPGGGELSDLNKIIDLVQNLNKIIEVCLLGITVCVMYWFAADTGDWEP